jgi:RNA polymerase sigma factor (TIGR02999 family)
MTQTPDVTVLLRAWQQGDREAGDALFAAVYTELRGCAVRYLHRERRDHTLQPTALVNEAYLRLTNQGKVDWEGRAHFLALAATMMRRILVDHARAHGAEKRGGDWERISLDVAEVDDAHDPMELLAPTEHIAPTELLALDSAIDALAAIDPFQARLVDLRFFGGLSIEETAAVLDSSPATVKREWALSRAWLFRRIEGTAT